MIWLADVANKHRKLSVQPRMTAKSIIAMTRDMDTVKFFTEIGYPYQNNNMKLTRITEENKQTKMIIRNYPSYMPLDYIEDLPSVLWMKRETRHDNKAPRDQVLAPWEGESPTTLQFPGMRPCRVESYVGKPAFCSNCQKWGQSVAMRRENKLRILCGKSQHQAMQGKNKQWGESSTEVPKLLSGTQRLECQVSTTTRFAPPRRQGSGNT